MKKKLLVLPLLALTVGMLSGCTKDDIKAIQDHDAEQDSRLDALEGEVAGLKNQISALRTELEGKINDAKSDYQAKIDSANGEISTLQTQLQTLSTNFDSAKAELKADYEAKIKAVDDKLNPLKEELLAKIAQEKGALNDLITGLRADLDQLSEDYAIDVADLQGQIDSISSGFDALLTSLDTQFTSINDQFDAVGTALNNLISAFTTFQTNLLNYDAQNDDMVYAIFNIAYSFSMDVYDELGERCDAIEAQAAADYETITGEYTAAINELADEMSAEQQNILDAIDDLQNQIDDLNDYLNEYVQLLQDDYQSQIDALVDRIGALEDVPVYNVTFDLNYDFYDGSVPDSYTVRVLRGDKLNDSKYALPTNFTNRPGNELVQWNYGDTDDEWVLFGYPVTENMTLKAEWTSTSENHSYDWFHPNEFQREKLDAKGHVRYRCSTHGDACYYDIAEKAGLMFVEDSFTISGRGTVVSGKIAQGRFYAGQIVDVQHGNGETRQHTIKQVLISGVDKGFAVAGDTVSLIFESADLYRTDVTSGCMITKADEMILSDEFYVNFHLFSSEEVSYYSSSSPSIQARTNPVMNGYRPELYYAKRGRTVSITEIEYPGANEYLQPGESAGAVMKIEAPKNVCYIPVGEDFGFGIDFFGDGNRSECLPIRESSRVIGYVEIIEYNKVLIQSANVTNDTFVTVLHADDDLGYGEYSYYLHDDDQFWDYDGDWNDYYYPTFRGLAGWDRNVDPSGSYEWDVGEYATTDVSFTVYAQWDWEFNMIFDFEGTDNFKDYSHDDEKGECVTGLFVNAGNWSIEVGDQVVLLEGDYHGGYVEGTTTTIDYIYDWEFEDDFVTSYRGSKDPMYDNIVDIYLRNLTDASMSNVCGIKLKKNYSSYDSVLVIGNSGRGGVDPRGVGLDTKRIATGKALPTINDYIAPTRKLLGFDANASATTPTYAPGAVYDGTDGRLYAIWDQTAEIFSVKTLDSMGISGRGWRAAFEVKGAAVKVGITSSDQKFYVRFSTGATMLAYINMMSVNLNQLRNTSAISPTIQEASVGQTVWVQFRYISGNNLGTNTYRYHIDYIWAQA